jgi:hypothetical protein
MMTELGEVERQTPKKMVLDHFSTEIPQRRAEYEVS